MKWIVAGMGWELGKEAAREGIDAVRKRNEPLTPEQEKQLAEQQRAEAKARANAEKAAAKAAVKAERDRKKAKVRAEKEIDAELKALKKKM